MAVSEDSADPIKILQRFVGADYFQPAVLCESMTYPQFNGHEYYEDYRKAAVRAGFINGDPFSYEAQCKSVIICMDEQRKYRGSVLITEAGPIWVLHRMFVLEGKRKAGVGTALIETALFRAKEEGVSLVQIYGRLYQDNRWLNRLQQHYGFNPIPASQVGEPVNKGMSKVAV